ncbi:LysR family transcriptional regulator [Pantoea ananatis]|uniref:LysR family transcriptional regulator n=1 Tax=Pantoea ananas TaxID=553 RepID=UPI003FA478C2
MDRDNNRGMRDWLIFIRTAESGSLSEAARQLDMSTAAVSKAITRFERYLDTVLFTRTTRGIILTDSGQTTLSRAREIASSFNSLLEEIRNPYGEIKGSIRLAAPAIVCEFLANNWVYEYSRLYPRVRVFLDARERVDLSHQSPELDDVVLRSGKIESEDLVHRKLRPIKLLLCASPDYLKLYPAITHPSELENHNLFGMHQHGLAGPMMISRNKESFLVEHPTENGISSNNLLAMLNLVVQGKGISLAMPEWLAEKYINCGLLVTVLPEWRIPDLPVWLIWRQRPRQTALFTHFRDYIEKCWSTLKNIDDKNIIIPSAAQD